MQEWRSGGYTRQELDSHHDTWLHAAARELVCALRRRRAPSAISGLGTRLFLLLQRMVSRKTAIIMMGTSSPIRDTS
jgi:hypothetical protein